MTIVQTEDNRNLEWRNSNLGSKMLAKMGWTEGAGIGKRNVNTTALRAVKRQQGLGIGAKRQTEGGPSESTGTFAAVLANLQAHHGTPSTATGTKKSSKKEAKRAAKKAARNKSKLSLPKNKVLAGHARKMRAAKFGAKSAEDMACIFGNTEVVTTAQYGGTVFGTVAGVGATAGSGSAKKRPRQSEVHTKKDDEKSSSSSSSEEEERPPKAAARGTDKNNSSNDDDDDISKEKELKRAKKKRKKEKQSNDQKKPKKEKKSKKDKKKKSKSE